MPEEPKPAEAHAPPANKEKAWLDLQRRLAAVYGIAGIAVGYASFAFNQPLQSLGLAIVVFAVLTLASKKVFNPEARLGEKRKWWGTPAVVYFGLWLVVWTIFYNVFIVKAV
jgi:hypothetical protein